MKWTNPCHPLPGLGKAISTVQESGPPPWALPGPAPPRPTNSCCPDHESLLLEPPSPVDLSAPCLPTAWEWRGEARSSQPTLHPAPRTPHPEAGLTGLPALGFAQGPWGGDSRDLWPVLASKEATTRQPPDCPKARVHWAPHTPPSRKPGLSRWEHPPSYGPTDGL